MKKGQKMPKEAIEKMRAKLKGRRCCMRTEFGKGHTPWNKGTKGLMKKNKGSFKKGNKPVNHRGGYKICEDGIYVMVGDKYSYQKNGKQIIIGKYESLARKKYREAFGEFDKKLIVYHKDEDIFNNEIENLELITRAELLKRNAKKNPRKKNCIICGKEFLSKKTNHKTCSEKCSKENNKRLSRGYHQKYLEKMKEYKRNWKMKQRILTPINTYTSLPQSL